MGDFEIPLVKFSKRYRMTIDAGDYECPLDGGIVDGEYCKGMGGGLGCNRKGRCHAFQHPELNKPKE